MEKITKRDWVVAGISLAATATGIYVGAKIKEAIKNKKAKSKKDAAPAESKEEKPQAEAAQAAN